MANNSFILDKKEGFNLNKNSQNGLKKVVFGLGWSPIKKSGFLSIFSSVIEEKIDLDASCVILDENKEVIDAVYFSKQKSNTGAVTHSGDNRTGEGDGDDEQIEVDFQKLPSNANYLVFTVTSFSGQRFDLISESYCRIIEDGEEKAKATLNDKGSYTGLISIVVKKTPEGWVANSVGKLANGRYYADLCREIGRTI